MPVTLENLEIAPLHPFQDEQSKGYVRRTLLPPTPLKPPDLSFENGSLPLDPYNPPTHLETNSTFNLAGPSIIGSYFANNHISPRKPVDRVQILRKLLTLKRRVRKWKHHARMTVKQNTPVKVGNKLKKYLLEEVANRTTPNKYCRAQVDIPKSPFVSTACRIGGDDFEHEILVVAMGQPADPNENHQLEHS